MKKLITLTLLFFLAKQLSAQTVNGNHILPIIGEVYKTHSINNEAVINTGNAGANQIWDFSNVLYDVVDTNYFKVVAPASTPYASSYPNATIAIKSYSTFDTTYARYDYQKQAGNQNIETLFSLGSMSSVFSFINDSAELIDQLPMNFNDVIGGNYCYTSDILGSSYSYCGASQLIFDGTGTLILPYGTYNNIYRFHYSKYEVEAGATDTIYVSRYYWYKPLTHKPLMEYQIYHETTGFADTSAQLLVKSSIVTTGIDETISIQAEVFPNPAHESLSVRLGKNVTGTVSLLNTLGQTVLTQKISNEKFIKISLTGLPQGAYLLQVSADDGKSLKRITVL